MNLTFVLTNKNNEKAQFSLSLSEMPETDKFSINDNYEYVSCIYSTEILNNNFIKKVESYILANEIIKIQILSDSDEILMIENPTVVNSFITVEKETINKKIEFTKTRV